MKSFTQKLRELKRKSINGDVLINIHHTLMKEYGWIAFEEFKRLPLPTVMNLLNEINKERERHIPMPVVIMGYAKRN